MEFRAIETLIGAMAPRYALKRAAARVALSNLRKYDAAAAGRQTWGWWSSPTSANAEVYYTFPVLRDRARELVRNSPLAAKGVRVLTNNVVGTGIVAQACTPNDAFNKQVDTLWNNFVTECDYGGQMDFYGQQRMAVRSIIEGGETVTRKRIVNDKRLPIPLQFQLLEGDFLDHRKNQRLEQGRVHQGVTFNNEDKRTGYWLYRAHPGDAPFALPQSYISDEVPASQVIHLYEILRIGQIRGVPWLTPSMINVRELDTYEEAELIRKRIEACVAAIVMGIDDESEASITPTVKDAQGNSLEQFTPGMVAIARGTKDIKFTSPAQNGQYAEYKRSKVQTIAAGWDMTYELLSGDLSRVNFSSIKAGINEFRRSVEVLQWLTVIPMDIHPKRKAAIDIALLSGKLQLPDGMDIATAYRTDYTTPRFEAVDPLKETNADVAAVRAFLMSPQEAIKRRGFDPDQLFVAFKQWHDKLKAAGMVSDADAALAPKAGAAKGSGGSSDGEGGSNAALADSLRNVADLIEATEAAA